MKNPKDLCHPMEEADEDKIGGCRLITILWCAVVFVAFYVLLTMTPFLDVIFGGK